MKMTQRLDRKGPVMKICERITFFNSRYTKGDSFQLKLEWYAKALCKSPMQKSRELDLGTEPLREKFAE